MQISQQTYRALRKHWRIWITYIKRLDFYYFCMGAWMQSVYKTLQKQLQCHVSRTSTINENR